MSGINSTKKKQLIQPHMSRQSTRIDPRLITTPYVLPTSNIDSPGHILQVDKGTPPFYKFFVTLYEEFQEKAVDEDGQSLQRESEELVEIVKNVILHYGIKVHIKEPKENTMLILRFLNLLAKVVYSFPRELFASREIGQVHISISEEKTKVPKLNMSEPSPKDQSFILCASKTNQDYLAEIHHYLSPITHIPLDLVKKQGSHQRSQSPKTSILRKKNYSQTNSPSSTPRGSFSKCNTSGLDDSSCNSRRNSNSKVIFGAVTFNE